MSGFREIVLPMLPDRVRCALRPWWRRFFRFKQRTREWWVPYIVWVVWLGFQCARYRKKAVVICRMTGIGDVICSFPICDEIRRRYPGKLLVFMTEASWRDVVILSRSADLVYANSVWVYPFTLPASIRVVGLVEKIYNPLTTGEQLRTSGTTTHLTEDLAASCGLTLRAQQPKLYPSEVLIERTRMAYALDRETLEKRLLIGINPGPSWRVREWQAFKWQKLINSIHAELDAVVIQFGTNRGDGSSEYDNLTGVKSVAARLKGEELVALIASCDLIISIDSGPVHVAGAVGTPVIGLFGPLDPASRLPPDPSAPAIGLCSNVPCLFCHNRTPIIHWFDGCPNDIACMRKLDDQTVFAAVKFMLARNKTPRAKESVTALEPIP
jgi:ADP-heptose:LPS heptosyltransferase